MGKVLITCEKPDAALNIAEILDVPTKKINGSYYENDEYIVVWSYGHLIKWKEPDEINKDWKEWSLDPLPFRFDIKKHQKIIPSMSKQVGVYKTLLNRADVDYVVNAGDADREGLLIQEELYAWGGCKKPIKVLWSQSLTSKEIIKCMNNLKDRKDFLPLLDAAIARTTIDYMLGISETRGLSLTYCKGQKVNYGRCQTPLLKLLSDREREIKDFKVSDYYEIELTFDNLYNGILLSEDQKENQKFNDLDEAKNVLNSLDKSGRIVEYTKTLKKENIEKLYSLSSLQKEMGAKYHYTADKTLKIAQKLYEMKLTSYPRTDTEYINNEVLDEIEERIKAAKNIIKTECKLDITKLNKVCKPNKVTGHHAILPTEVICSKEKFESLTNDEKLVYQAICKKLLAVIMPEYEYNSIYVITKVGDKLFKTTGIEVKSLGWKEIYQNEKVDKEEDDSEKSNKIPELSKDKEYSVSDKQILTKQTKAPSRYTTSTIISLMEKWKIGRPATQAEIIQRLIDMDFVKLNKNKYEVLQKGLAFIDLVLDELKAPDLTKKIEEKLQKIADGEYKSSDLIEEVFNNQVQRLELYKNMANENNSSFINNVSKTDYTCPLCNSPIINMPYSYNCSNKECGLKINKEISKKKIPERAFKDLFEKGRCGLVKGFISSRTGKEFNAKIIINKNTKQIEFLFDNKK